MKQGLYSNEWISAEIQSAEISPKAYREEVFLIVLLKILFENLNLETRYMCPSALSKMAPWLRYWLLSDNYRSIKADLYNKEETNEGPSRSKRFAFSLQSNLGYDYETKVFSSLPIQSISLDYDLDLKASNMILAYNKCLAM